MAIDRHTTFQSTTLQEELETYGYVILDLLSEEEVSDCVSFYQNEVSGFGQDDFLHTHMAPKEVKLKTHEFVKPIMEKRLNQLLADYKVGLGYYMIKPKHGKEPMRVHQDKSMVDETKYTGLIVWCPLVDVDENNGGLLIVDKSHRFISNHRGTDIDMPYSGIEDMVEQEQYSKPLRLKAGEAVIFDHRLWHASTSNTSKEDRVVVAAVAVPKESSYVHYQANSSGLLDKYKCGENFPLEFDVTDALPNDCQLVESDLPTNKELTEEEFLTLFEEYNPPTQQPSIWKRLMASVSSFG